MAEVISALVNEPYCLSIEEIGNLTPYQVRNLYFREKETPESEIPWFFKSQPAPNEQPVDKEKELFWKVNKEWRNLPEEQVEALWKSHVKSKSPKKTEPKPKVNPNPNPANKEKSNGKIKT
jgi:hypothetical protein